MNRASVGRCQAGILALILVQPLAADEDEAFFENIYGTEELITIATGTPVARDRAPAVASVITHQDILRTGATTLSEALESVPGLHVSYSPAGYNPAYIIRGNHSEFNPHVLVLVNDIPVTNVFLGNRGQNWGGMPLHDVERIEIIRGPGSALFGADAFSGVINVITRSASDIDGLTSGVRGGSFGTREAWFLHAKQMGALRAAISADFFQTEGDRSTIERDGQTALDELFGTSVSFAPGPVENGRDNFDIRIDVEYENLHFRSSLQKRRGGVGVGGVDILDPVGEGNTRRRSADLTYRTGNDGDEWTGQVRVSFFDTLVESDLMLAPPGAVFPTGAFPEGVIGNPDVAERHYRVDMESFYRGLRHHRVRLGAGYKREELSDIGEEKNFFQPEGSPFPVPLPGGLQDVSNTAPFITEEARDIAYLAIQDEWLLASDWTLTAGLRADWYSDFGTTINPRLALVWQTNYTLTTKLLYGRAFRPPSFAESFNVNNPVALGNPNLDPETIDTVEIAFDWRPSESTSAILNIYYYEMRDILQFVPESAMSPVLRAQNTGKRRGRGGELEIAWEVSPRLTMMGNYSYQKTVDLEHHEDVGFAPQHQAYLRVDFKPTTAFLISLNATHIASRPRPPGDTRRTIDDYSLVDVNLRYNLSNNTELAILAFNVLDENAFEPTANALFLPEDLPIMGRRLLLEIRHTF